MKNFEKNAETLMKKIEHLLDREADGEVMGNYQVARTGSVYFDLFFKNGRRAHLRLADHKAGAMSGYTFWAKNYSEALNFCKEFGG